MRKIFYEEQQSLKNNRWHSPKWSTDFDVEKKSIFFRFGHHKWFAIGKNINVNGDFHLLLFLKNGKKIQLGSKNPEGLKWAMGKLIAKNEKI